MPRFIIYTRKSLEDDDRQVQSIASQESELQPIAVKRNLTVVKVFGEARSAKEPGRPLFNQMMAMINRAEADGVLCWKLDRLARNPIDGAAIIWAMKQRGLVVMTPQQTFSQAEDNQILMYIEFGMAQKYIDDLGRNTKRGLKAKAEKGWFPGLAPIGYLNSKIEERGQKTILVDPERFSAVRRMWDLMLTGNHKPTGIQKIADKEWGFRTQQRKRTGGKPLGRSTIYKMFSDPFYCGRYEYPKGSGIWHKGMHKPMVTEGEFERVRQMLSDDVPSRPFKEFDFPLAGLLRCGECDSAVTAHSKIQVRCSRCHFKSSVKNRQACGRCGLAMIAMVRPNIRSYAYYHCTRTLRPTCRQKCVSSTVLEDQVRNKVMEFALPQELKEWGLRYIETLREHEQGERSQIVHEKRKQLEHCNARLENLLKLKTAPENVNGTLISDDEYLRQREELLAQKNRIAKDADDFEANLAGKTRVTKRLLEFMAAIDPSEMKEISRAREVLRALGSNHVLIDKKLVVMPEFPFSELPPLIGADTVNFPPIEPENTQEKSGCLGYSVTACPTMERSSDENRTNALKSAMRRMWKKLNADDAIFRKFPFAVEEDDSANDFIA